VRWSNLAISRQPVNQHVAAVSTIPFGALAKCWTPNGFDMIKALEASYATDAVEKTGGAALGMQSLDVGKKPNIGYFDFRNKLSDAILNRDIIDTGEHGLMQYSAERFNMSLDDAAAWVGRYMRDLKNILGRSKK
jgi:hypothetical protein